MNLLGDVKLSLTDLRPNIKVHDRIMIVATTTARETERSLTLVVID